MNHLRLALLFATLLGLVRPVPASEPQTSTPALAPPTLLEYATIRWGGRGNTHAVMPDGQALFFESLFKQVNRPDRTDDRAFYMNVAMNALAKRGFRVATMTPEEIVMARVAATNTMVADNSPTGARLQVTKLCEDGNQLRLKFFEDRIESLQKQNTNNSVNAEISELKQLRAGEIGLQRALATFTKYVLAGKPYAVTTEEIQESFSDSQKRVTYFAKAIASAQEQRHKGSLSSEEFDREFDLLGGLQQHDIFLQQVLTGFAQEKAAYEQQRAAQQNGQPAQGNLWEQSGNTTFERLLNWAILAKMMQTPQANTVIIKRY